MNTDVPFYYTPKQLVILVKRAEMLVALHGVRPSGECERLLAQGCSVTSGRQATSTESGF